MARCTKGLVYGSGWTTRCRHEEGHLAMHGGFGQEGWPWDNPQWFDGSPNQIITDREDLYAWYEPLVINPLQEPSPAVTT